MTINLETLIADLCRKLNAGELSPHNPNLEADLRGTIKANEVKDANWHPEEKATEIADDVRNGK